MENTGDTKPKNFADWFVKSGYKSHGAWAAILVIMIFGFINKYVTEVLDYGYKEDLIGVIIAGAILLGSFIGMIAHAIITYKAHRKHG